MKPNHAPPTGLPDQNKYDEIAVCEYCNEKCDGDICQKCGRKVTRDSIEPRREKDLVDIFEKTRFEFTGIRPDQALEILTNGDCGD